MNIDMDRWFAERRRKRTILSLLIGASAGLAALALWVVFHS